MPSWINRTVLSGSSVDRNGTNSHTCTFAPANSGSLLVAVVAGAVTFTTPAGWSIVQSAINYSGLYVFSKTATTSESSFSTTHNGSDYLIQGLVYEFYSGSVLTGTAGSASNIGSSYTGPTCSGLSGTYSRFSARSWNPGNTPSHTVSCVWTTPTIEDYDVFSPGNGSTDGIELTTAYNDNATGSSFTPSSDITSSTGAMGEAISFAVSVIDPPFTGLVPAPFITA